MINKGFNKIAGAIKTLTPLLSVILFLFLITSCRQKEQKQDFSDMVYEAEADIQDELDQIKSIFYDIYSPIEAQRLFKNLNVVFDKDILNPVENIYKYNTSNKNAINLGVYGANMSFSHMFGQTQEAINYMSAIYRLADRLGISDNIVSEAENIRDRLIYDPDTLFKVASNIYISADKQLKESGRSGAASLILAGGWIEAIYIASSFYEVDNPDPNLAEQILTQKYSLDRLLALLSNHQDDEFTAKYILMLRQLKNHFDSVDILFEQDDLVIDTTNRTIESARPQFVYTDKQIADIANLVNYIRNDMVN